MSSTKPDVFVTPRYREHIAGSWLRAATKQSATYSVPVCLVSPALLDWIEKARDELTAAMFRVERPELRNHIVDLLRELEALLPEGGGDEK
jgi:hypothetical protein